MIKKFFQIVILCGLVLCAHPVLAGVISELEPFHDQDRVLVLAPHPDDEAIGAGGVTQQALKAGAKVKVVLLTNGENNELSFLVYKKRPVLRPKEILNMGELRYSESILALNVLGVHPNDIVDLGYPDFGTMDVFTTYWGNVPRPFRGMLSRSRHVPYTMARSFKAPFIGESILKDLESVILDFKPTKIFVSHPADTNRDHRALYLFTRVALWNLEHKMSRPEIYPYIIHVVGWPSPRGYHSSQVLNVPFELSKNDIHWYTVPLQESEIKRKYDAVNKYVSQVKYAPSYLVSFVRANELFGDYPDIPLVNQVNNAPVWQQVGSEAEGIWRKRTGNADMITSVAYARQGENLLVRLVLKHAIDKEIGVSVFLLGYRRDVPFAQMPKLNLLVGLDGFHIRDRKRNVPVRDVQYIAKDRSLLFVVPLKMIGDPERVLSTAKTSLYDLTMDESAWRILRLN